MFEPLLALWRSYRDWIRALWRNYRARVLVTLLPLLMLAFCSGQALAGDASLTWTLPTKNTDGTNIPASGPDALSHVLVEWFQCSSASATWPATPSSAQVPYPGTGYVVTNLGAGLHCFRVKAVNNAATSSDPSGVGTKLIPPAKPNPPVLTVQQTTAYRMRRSINGFSFVAYGTLPATTICKDQFAGDGSGTYHLVDRDAVTMFSPFDTKPDAAFAVCG